MKSNQITLHSGDETGHVVSVSTKALCPIQRSIIPNTPSETAGGQVSVFTFGERLEYKNSIINSVHLKYKIQNLGSVNIQVPITGIWGLLEYLKIREKGIEILNYDQKLCREIFMSGINGCASVKEFLNKITGTANINNLSTLVDTRTVAPNVTSPYYFSDFNEICNIFKFRHASFLDNVEIEFALLNPSLSNNILTKSLGITAGGSFNDIRVTNLELIFEISPFPDNVSVLNNSYKSDILIPHVFKKTFTVTPNSTNFKSINFGVDFPPLSNIDKLYLYFDNSTVQSPVNNHNIFVSSYITKIILKKNGQEVNKLEDSQVYSQTMKYNRNHGTRNTDGPYTSTAWITNAPTLCYNLSRDRTPYVTDGTSQQIQKFTGISNDRSGPTWELEIYYDLSTGPAYLDQLQILLFAQKSLCLYSDRNKVPHIIT